MGGVVCVRGFGAVGRLLGLFLARCCGEPVDVVVRREGHAEELNRGVVEVEGLVRGEYRVRAHLSIPEGCEYVLLATKAYDLASAVEPGRGAVYVVLSNGLGLLEGLIGAGYRAAGGVVDYGVMRLGDTGALVRGLGSVVLGPYRGLDVDVGPVYRALKGGGCNVALVGDIAPWIWLKGILNSVLNPLTAIAGVVNGRVLEDPHLRGVAREATLEALRVAEALGVRLPRDPLEYLAEVAGRTRDNKSSMLVDIESGRRTEVDHLTGYIVSEAERLGLETPVLRALYRLVKALEFKGGAVS